MIATRNTRETAHTERRVGDDHRKQWCKCARCGVVALCEPHFDFYVVYARPEPRLVYCEACLAVETARPISHIVIKLPSPFPGGSS